MVTIRAPDPFRRLEPLTPPPSTTSVDESSTDSDSRLALDRFERASTHGTGDGLSTHSAEWPALVARSTEDPSSSRPPPTSLGDFLSRPGTPSLKLGDQNPAVLDLQRALGLSSGGQTGLYGPTTQGYVRSFQQTQPGIRRDGVADRATVQAMLRENRAWVDAPSLDAVGDGVAVIAERMKGAAVEALQTSLGFVGDQRDGLYGGGTRDAVSAFQRRAGLVPSGVVDAATLAALGTTLTEEPEIPQGERFELSGSVGAGGQNSPADVEKVRSRLADLGYPTGDLNRGIRLFQSAIWGRNTLGGDGRVDPDGSTHRWLQAENAPRWQEMPASMPGVRNIDDNDHDHGTSWTVDLVRRAGAIYQRDHLASNPGDSPISTNNLSLPRGGDTPHHGTHETGMNVDISLPRTDGSFGGYYWDRGHDHEATKAQIRALIDAGAKTILYNDPRILRDPEFAGKVIEWPGHDHHLHVGVPVPDRVDPVDATPAPSNSEPVDPPTPGPVETPVTPEPTPNQQFDYDQIVGVRSNPNVSPEFIREVEEMAERLDTKPEYLLAVMSFESAGSFSPSKRNPTSGATGLIQFMPATARSLGTSISALSNMTPVQQLQYVEKYFDQYPGQLGTLEGLYTSVLSGRATPNPSDTLVTPAGREFRSPNVEYRQNRGLDVIGGPGFTPDGKITAGEATAAVSARLYGGWATVQRQLVDAGVVPQDQVAGFDDGYFGSNTAAAIGRFQEQNGLPQTGLLDDATGRALRDATR